MTLNVTSNLTLIQSLETNINSRPNLMYRAIPIRALEQIVVMVLY